MLLFSPTNPPIVIELLAGLAVTIPSAKLLEIVPELMPIKPPAITSPATEPAPPCTLPLA